MAAYHRDITCAELIEKGKEVKLSFQIDGNDAAASAPICSRLSQAAAATDPKPHSCSARPNRSPTRKKL